MFENSEGPKQTFHGAGEQRRFVEAKIWWLKASTRSWVCLFQNHFRKHRRDSRLAENLQIARCSPCSIFSASFPDVSFFFRGTRARVKHEGKGKRRETSLRLAAFSLSHGSSRFVLVTSSRSSLLRPYLADRSIWGGGRYSLKYSLLARQIYWCSQNFCNCWHAWIFVIKILCHVVEA